MKNNTLEKTRIEVEDLGVAEGMQNYNISVFYKGKEEIFPFHCGLACDYPTKEKLLWCLLSDRSYYGTEKDDIMEGLIDDSAYSYKKAKTICELIMENNKKLDNLFTEAELDSLNSALEDY